MRDFLMNIVTAHAVAKAPRAPNRRRHVVQIAGGIAIAVIIGAALFIAVAATG